MPHKLTEEELVSVELQAHACDDAEIIGRLIATARYWQKTAEVLQATLEVVVDIVLKEASDE